MFTVDTPKCGGGEVLSRKKKQILKYKYLKIVTFTAFT